MITRRRHNNLNDENKENDRKKYFQNTVNQLNNNSYESLPTVSKHQSDNDMNNFRDRTKEFQSVSQTIISRKTNGIINKPANNIRQRSQFMQAARKIGRDLSYTCEKLEKLAYMVKKKSLFDDQPMEIQELTFVIKQDINSLNTQIGQLQKFSVDNQTSSKHKQMHSSTVVISLQSRLANISNDLKSVLETRTETMKAQKVRREQFTQPTNFTAVPSTGASTKHSLIMQDEAAAQAAISSGHVNINMDGHDDHGSSHYQQQLQLIEQQDAYIQDRANDMQKIEETIVELGGIFQQLATMVHEQEEMVQRIDSNIDNTQLNVEAAHGEILKYFQSVTSNRWLMIKVFGILIFFFIIFVVFMA